MLEAMKSMTPEQAKEMLEKMSPEERAQAEQIQKGMADLQYLVTKLKPDAADPDASVSVLKVIATLGGAPVLCERMEAGWEKFGEVVDDNVLKRVEDALVEAGGLEEGALDGACAAGAPRKHALLLYWHMHRSSMEELAASLPNELDAMRGGANQLATQLLMKAQMLMPQQRWVQPTLAVARVSALIANGLPSHTDAKSLEAMKKILLDPETGGPLPFPKLSLSASARPRNASHGEECVAGQHVLLRAEVTREHASAASDEQPAATNPQGILEAFWLYIEGVKPEGTPNSLITSQPLAVKDLTERTLTAEMPFQAPPVAGKYTLRVHVLSTSVVGVEYTTDCEFTVVEDDVPDLE